MSMASTSAAAGLKLTTVPIRLDSPPQWVHTVCACLTLYSLRALGRICGKSPTCSIGSGSARCEKLCNPPLRTPLHCTSFAACGPRAASPECTERNHTSRGALCTHLRGVNQAASVCPGGTALGQL
jgi:hypothetical protein